MLPAPILQTSASLANAQGQWSGSAIRITKPRNLEAAELFAAANADIGLSGLPDLDRCIPTPPATLFADASY
jgi:hypothetical protein